MKAILYNYEQIKQQILDCSHEDARVLASFLYGCCARIGEITRPDYYANPKARSKESLKSRDVSWYPRIINGKKKNFLMILIKPEKKQGEMPYFTLINPETKTVNGQEYSENWLCDIIVNYANDFDEEEELFPFQTNWGGKLIRKHFGFNPHLFRHLRATHFRNGEVNGKEYDIQDVQVIGRWADINTPAKYYAHRDMTKLVKSL